MIPRNTQQYDLIVKIIWFYFWLLLFEGALRKWVLPSLSNPLLVVRDPVLTVIYFLYLRLNIAPINRFCIGAIVFAVFSILISRFSECNQWVVNLYGVRTNFYHVPLIFVMYNVLTREDVYKFGRYVLYLCIPMTLLIIAQFYMPQTHFINRQPGGDVGVGFMGALGRFRPPGVFSFVISLAAFYTLALAFLVHEFIQPKLLSPLFRYIIGGCILIAIPFSLSRSLALSCALVMIISSIALCYQKFSVKKLYTIIGAGIVLSLIITLIPFSDDGIETFKARWHSATGIGYKGFEKNIIIRYLDDFRQPWYMLQYVPIVGLGIGLGTNVGAKIISGQVGFYLSESEWCRIIFESGPILGVLFILYRVGLFISIGTTVFRACSKQNALPIILFSAIGLLLLSGVWGPPTQLGFSVFASGLALAACNPYRFNAIDQSVKVELANKAFGD